MNPDHVRSTARQAFIVERIVDHILAGLATCTSELLGSGRGSSEAAGAAAVFANGLVSKAVPKVVASCVSEVLGGVLESSVAAGTVAGVDYGLVPTELPEPKEQARPEAGVRKKKLVQDEPRRKRPILPLKHNREEIDVATALAELRDIRFAGDTKQRLQELVELANGHSERVSPAVMKRARIFGLLADDRVSLTDVARLVLLSAVEDTREGPVLLTNPFILNSEGDKLVAEREQRRCDRNWRKIRGLPLKDDPKRIDEQEFRSP